jgi:hypothetical protein
MALRVRNTAFAYSLNQRRYGLGLSFGSSDSEEAGRLFCKLCLFFCVGVRGLSGSAPSNNENKMVTRAARENHLAWLNLSRNKLARIPKRLCELSELQWLDLSGMRQRIIAVSMQRF